VLSGWLGRLVRRGHRDAHPAVDELLVGDLSPLPRGKVGLSAGRIESLGTHRSQSTGSSERALLYGCGGGVRRARHGLDFTGRKGPCF
jgi:hypothetical protein